MSVYESMWGVVTVALLTGLGGAVAPCFADEPLAVRAFVIRHQSLSDAAELVEPLLSDAASVTLRKHLDTLVVEDRAEVLRRVAQLLESWDLPPRNVELTVTLFLGSRSGEGAASTAPDSRGGIREIRGVHDVLVDATKWDDYENLGSRSLVGSERSETSAVVSDRYRVMFVVDSVHESSKQVRVRFSLYQTVEAVSGLPAEEKLQLSTGMTLKEGRTAVVGAAKSPLAPEALFVAVQVKLR